MQRVYGPVLPAALTNDLQRGRNVHRTQAATDSTAVKAQPLLEWPTCFLMHSSALWQLRSEERLLCSCGHTPSDYIPKENGGQRREIPARRPLRSHNSVGEREKRRAEERRTGAQTVRSHNSVGENRAKEERRKEIAITMCDIKTKMMSEGGGALAPHMRERNGKGQAVGVDHCSCSWQQIQRTRQMKVMRSCSATSTSSSNSQRTRGSSSSS